MALAIEKEVGMPDGSRAVPQDVSAAAGHNRGPSRACGSWQEMIASVGMSSDAPAKMPKVHRPSGADGEGSAEQDGIDPRNEGAQSAENAGDFGRTVSVPAANFPLLAGRAAEAEIVRKPAPGRCDATPSAADSNVSKGRGKTPMPSQKKAETAARTAEGTAIPLIATIAMGASLPVSASATVAGVDSTQEGSECKLAGSARMPIIPAHAQASSGLKRTDAKQATLEPEGTQDVNHAKEPASAKLAQVESAEADSIGGTQIERGNLANPDEQASAAGNMQGLVTEVSSASAPSVQPRLTRGAPGFAGAIPPQRTASHLEGFTGPARVSMIQSMHAIAGAVADRERHVSSDRPGSMFMEPSELARDLSGGGATILDHPAATPSSSQETSARETFAALDAGTSPAALGWIHAASQHAEAGFQDPALGWVGVRADMSGGGIHAAVVPGSADAAQALAGHLAGLTAHLAAQHMEVHSVTVAAPDAVSNGRSADPGTQQGSYSGSGRHGEKNDSSGVEHVGTEAIAARGGRASTTPNGPALNSTVVQRGGVYISVLA